MQMAHAPWHALLAPLPTEARVERRAVAPPDVTERLEGRAIAGWEQLVSELPAGDAGMRVVLVVVDGADRVIAASDLVMRRVERRGANGAPPSDDDVEFNHDSIGGRFDDTGAFHGTRWYCSGKDGGEDDPTPFDAVTRAPDDDEVAKLLVLVDEVRRRAPARVS